MYIVVTKPEFWEGEAEALTLMLESGLERLHIRKPGSTAAERERLLRAIPACFHNRIVVGERLMDEHTCHACHSLSELSEWQSQIAAHRSSVSYLSLSPIYDSISKSGYHAAFTPDELRRAHEEGIINERVIALGGICRTNAEETLAMGFGGVMVLGDAWRHSDSPLVLSIDDARSGVEEIEEQMKAVYDARRAEAICVGRIANLESARVLVRELLRQRRCCVLPLVYAPCLMDAKGEPGMNEECRHYIAEHLLPLCTLLVADSNTAQRLRQYSRLPLSAPVYNVHSEDWHQRWAVAQAIATSMAHRQSTATAISHLQLSGCPSV